MPYSGICMYSARLYSTTVAAAELLSLRRRFMVILYYSNKRGIETTLFYVAFFAVELQ